MNVGLCFSSSSFFARALAAQRSIIRILLFFGAKSWEFELGLSLSFALLDLYYSL
jgi:hypothetical protein